jgi:23S rRNA (uracil1939-C5)-methyltransferase
VARIEGGRRRWGHIVEVLEAAPDRVPAPCEYFRDWSCGGCQWQMIAYQGQLARKRSAVDGAMERTGVPIAVSAVHALDDPWRYRSTVGISLGRSAGFRRRGSLAIVPIRDCPISHPLIGELMAALNDALLADAIPNFRGRLRLEVRVAETDGRTALQVLIRANEGEAMPAAEHLERLATTLDGLPMVGGVSLLTAAGEIDVLSGDLLATAIVAGRPVSLFAGSFFQTNPRLLPTLIKRLQQESEPLAGKQVADVYGGTGVFGLFLAGEAAGVTVIESDPLAVQAGERTAGEWGLQNVRFLRERAESALRSDDQYDLVIVDPPRSGLSEEVRAALVTASPNTILYVSCLAESLARDLMDFIEAGYGIESLELFDFYPQTYHVELLAVLRA